MIINQLAKYYDILVDNVEEIPKWGFSVEKISYEFVLNKEGVLEAIISLKSIEKRGKKEYEFPKKVIVPEKTKKASNIVSDFLSGNVEYVLGLCSSKESRHINKVKEKFEAFKALHHEIIDGKKSDLGNALLNFVDNFDYESYKELLDDYLEDLFKGNGIVFSVNNKYLHDDELLKQLWIEKKIEDIKELEKMQCSITGEKLPIARLHQSIKGVVNAQSSGASIVSFNAEAYESYGKTKMQGLNAPISDQITFKYTSILNYLIDSSEQKIQIADATTVFWAESSNKGYIDIASFLFDPSVVESEENPHRDVISERNIKEILITIRNGTVFNYSNINLDENTRFCVLGLSPNASRLSVRYFYHNKFEVFVNNMMMHYKDFEIEKSYKFNPDFITIKMIVDETCNPKTSKKLEPNPLLSGSLIRSIINGEMYPRILLTSIINRIRCDNDMQKDKKHILKINYIRVAIIKAYLSRFSRIYKKDNYKEVLKVSLNENATSVPYLLGRLFSILEKAQKEAIPNIETTIKDRYFSSASATPAVIFPTLLKLTQAHISKLKYGYVYSNKIGEIVEMIDSSKFPKHLNLEDQGSFIIGYYHQNNANYRTTKSKEEI